MVSNLGGTGLETWLWKRHVDGPLNEHSLNTFVFLVNAYQQAHTAEEALNYNLESD